MANAPRSGAARRGYILILSYLVTAILTLWTFVAFNRSATELRAADRFVVTNQAFQVAEAGLDRGLVWMHQQPSPPSGTASFQPFGEQVCVDATCDTWYSVTIDPDDQNPVNFIDSYSITAVGQTERVQVARQLLLVLRAESFSRYSYFTTYERTSGGSAIWFTSRDYLQGPVHSNDRFNIAYDPVFDGPVTSTASSLNYYNGGPPTDNPDFNQGLTLNSPSVQLPLTVQPLRIAAASGSGLWLEGNTTIQFQSNGAMLVTNAAKGWVNQSVAAPANGAVFVNQGNVTVSGTMHGQMTVGTSNDVLLANNVQYATNPQTDSTSTDLLGLVAEGNVVVSQSAPTDVTIQASVMALNESFSVANWWVGPPKGTLSVYGGIIQYRRGAVGTFSGQNKVSGYSKNYRYDPRLSSMSPPFFPTTTEFVEELWQDQSSSGS